MWFDLEDYWEEAVGREMIQGVTSDSGWCSEVSEEGGETSTIFFRNSIITLVCGSKALGDLVNPQQTYRVIHIEQ